MRRAFTVVLALAVLATAGVAQAADYGFKAARAALSGNGPVLLVAVPRNFLHQDPKMSNDAAEVAGDWSFHLGEWTQADKGKTRVVIVETAELARLIKTPAVGEDGCATVFIKSPSEALAHTAGCVLVTDQYAKGVAWMKGATEPGPDAELSKVALKRR